MHGHSSVGATVATPQGVILYGEPGTGKTLLAKAVAHSTSATFLRVVGSELIQKYLGDGPKLVRELFRVADELSPSIVFIGGVFLLSSLLHGALAACKHSRVACRMPERTAGIGPCLKHAEAWLVLPGACTSRATCDGSTAAAARPRSSTSHLRQMCAADEIDAIGTKRYEATSGGEREIQRTMLELLNQLDGFDSMGDVKVDQLPASFCRYTLLLLVVLLPEEHSTRKVLSAFG